MKKNKIISVISYIAIILIINMCFYVQLINDEFCGIRSKIAFVVLSTIVTLAITGIILYIKKQESIKPEKIFLIIAIIIGVIYMLATPMFKGHDEQYHWYKSYATSIGHFLPIKNEEGAIGDMLPRMVEDVFEVQGFFLDIDYKTMVEAVKYSIDSPKTEGNELTFTYNAPTASYSPIQMMPQALGILLARSIGLTTYIQAYFGRLFNLFFYVITGYFAIKWIPSKKYFLAVFLLAPKIMYLSSTMSGDNFINGTAILFITYILKLRDEKTILNKKDILTLLILTPCIAVAKVVYFPILAFACLIPKECFKNRKRKILFISIIAIIAIITVIGWGLISAQSTARIATNGQNQIEFALKNPIEFGFILIRSLGFNFANWSLDIVGRIYGMG